MIRQAVPILHVTNAAAAEEFYCRRLGFHMSFCVPPDMPRRDPCYMGLVRDGAEVHLSSHAGDGVAGGVVYLLVDDVDALHDEMQRSGVRVALEPTDQTWHMREMYVRDPDGNSVRFGCPVAP